MSLTALEMKKKQTENYFLFHPDSQEVRVVDSDPAVIFPALFDFAYSSGEKDKGHVKAQTKEPKITFFSGHADSLIPMKTEVSLAGYPGKTFKVVQVRADETDGTYQGEAWLV